jgi:hypothetical protein
MDETNQETILVLVEDSSMYLVGQGFREVYLGYYEPGRGYRIRIDVDNDSVKVTKTELWSWSMLLTHKMFTH